MVESKVEGNNEMPLTDSADVIDRMKEAAGVETDAKLADILGKHKQNISQAKKKGVPPAWIFAIGNKYSYCIDWIAFGKGPKKRVSQQAQNGFINGTLNHNGILKQFQDRDRAKDINLYLIDLERLNPDMFKEVGAYIKGLVTGIQAGTEDGGKLSSDRRQSQRRQLDEPDKIPDGIDRRGGLERRQSGL